MSWTASNIARRLRPHDYAVFGFLTIVLVIQIVASPRVPGAAWVVAGHVAGMMAIFAFTQWVPMDRPWGYALRHWYVLVVIPLSFSEMGLYVHHFRVIDYDPILVEIDHWLLGVHPTVWLQRWHHPVLVEVSQLCYSTFFFLPVVLALVLLARRRWELFERCAFLIAYGFYLSYLGYMVVPAVGPRLVIGHLHPFPLEGVALAEPIRHALDSMEKIKRDCFPSGHTMMTLATLWGAARWHRPTFWVMLPIGSVLIFATVYLRYHYVIDVVMGAVFALFVFWTLEPLYRWLAVEKGPGTFFRGRKKVPGPNGEET